MQQEIQLNIIPFKAPIEDAEFAFYTAKQDGYCPILKDDLIGAIEGLVEHTKPVLINQHIEKVYQFSRMYRKSVSQQNLLVIIKYPKWWPRYSHTSLTTNYPTTARRACGFCKIIIK
ncbi:MAG: hypothetical protein WAT46_00930 [Saprospiraceae bacterium]